MIAGAADLALILLDLQMLAAGMYAYVTEPLDFETLADAMQRVRRRPALVPNPVPTPVPATP